jgi:hypothetical protein
MNTTQLANLKAFVENFPERLIRVDYYSTTKNCGCVVGEMLVRQCNVQPSDLESLGDYVDDWMKEDGSDTRDWAIELVDLFGLTPREFRVLQIKNDERYDTADSDNDMILRAVAIKQYLLDLIALEEGQINVQQ